MLWGGLLPQIASKALGILDMAALRGAKLELDHFKALFSF